jgi:hypothetical protein
VLLMLVLLVLLLLLLLLVASLLLHALPTDLLESVQEHYHLAHRW